MLQIIQNNYNIRHYVLCFNSYLSERKFNIFYNWLNKYKYIEQNCYVTGNSPLENTSYIGNSIHLINKLQKSTNWINPDKVLKKIYKILIQKCYYKFEEYFGDQEKFVSTYY